MKGLPDESFISHLFVTESLQLYIAVTTKDDYQLYERDLDVIMSTLVMPNEVASGNTFSKTPTLKATPSQLI
jgi:hypothetical protein